MALRGDLGEVLDVIGTGESLDGRAAQARPILFRCCASPCFVIGPRSLRR